MRRRASLILPCLAAAAMALGLAGCQLAFDVDELAPKGNLPPGGDKAALGEGCARDADCSDGLTCLENLPGGYCTVSCGSELDCAPLRCDRVDPASANLYCAITCDLGCRDTYSCDDALFICVPGNHTAVCPTPNDCRWIGPECLRGDMVGPCPSDCCIPQY